MIGERWNRKIAMSNSLNVMFLEHGTKTSRNITLVDIVDTNQTDEMISKIDFRVLQKKVKIFVGESTLVKVKTFAASIGESFFQSAKVFVSESKGFIGL